MGHLKGHWTTTSLLSYQDKHRFTWKWCRWLLHGYIFMVNNIKNNSGTYYKSHKWRSPRPLMHSLLVIFTYCIIKLLPAGGFGVLAFAAPAGRQILDGLTLITHYSVWGRGGPPATLINDLLVWFASGRAVAGPDQMACDRLSCGAVHMQLVHRPGAQFTFHMHYRVKEMRHTSFWDNFFFFFFFPRSVNVGVVSEQWTRAICHNLYLT